MSEVTVRVRVIIVIVKMKGKVADDGVHFKTLIHYLNLTLANYYNHCHLL